MNIIREEDELNIIKEEEIVQKYKIDYYRGNISNLVNLISEIMPLEKIPDFLKRALLLNDLIYSEEYYFKGIFPKIIVSTDGEQDNKIKGLCSFYYENSEDLNENLIIRINCIFAIDNYEEQITKMIEYIKNNVKFNRIDIYLLYDKIEDKFLPNKEAKELFKNNLGFKWLCVVSDEKLQQRYIRLCITKVENIDNKTTNNNFLMDQLSIITINNEEDAYELKNKIDVKSKDNWLNKKSFDKYINPNPIYSLIIENKKIKNEFINQSKKKELKELTEKVWRFVIFENGWNSIEDEKKKIKNIKFDIEQSIFKEIENYYMTKNLSCLCDLYQTYLSTNFENNYSIVIDDIYYNRISSDKIKILTEKRTNSIFFLIPSNDNMTFFYITELNKRLKGLLIDNSKNIYEQFLLFQPSTQKELFEFSISSYRDITYIPQTYKQSSKSIYIPSFLIKTHLFSYNFKNVEKNVKMTDIVKDIPSYLTSVDEFLNIKFKPDENIENSFSVIPIEGGKTDFIIREDFIIGIFDNEIINNEKLPLLQFLYVTKDHFLTKKNYIP